MEGLLCTRHDERAIDVPTYGKKRTTHALETHVWTSRTCVGVGLSLWRTSGFHVAHYGHGMLTRSKLKVQLVVTQVERRILGIGGDRGQITFVYNGILMKTSCHER